MCIESVEAILLCMLTLASVGNHSESGAGHIKGKQAVTSAVMLCHALTFPVAGVMAICGF